MRKLYTFVLVGMVCVLTTDIMAKKVFLACPPELKTPIRSGQIATTIFGQSVISIPGQKMVWKTQVMSGIKNLQSNETFYFDRPTVNVLPGVVASCEYTGTVTTVHSAPRDSHGNLPTSSQANKDGVFLHLMNSTATSYVKTCKAANVSGQVGLECDLSDDGAGPATT